ncbi:protein LYRIC [Hoplias malabaricus]|uniref:protein LYRIC n=1 Tax=Hoplias malabaricus TaxID=27720 RepID=UPI003461B06C
MALSLADRAEQAVHFVAEMLGVEAASPLALWPGGVLLLSAALGLIFALLLLLLGLGLHRPRTPRGEPTQHSVPEPGKAARAEEPKRKSRKRTGEKKPQRNGLAVEPQDEKDVKVESPDQAEPKADKAKKNKKKPKPPAKEAKSSPSERKDPEEAGAWETKVSNREKRQQRRKDKDTREDSGSPGGVEPNPSVSSAEQPIITPEEPQVTAPIPPTNTKTTSTSSPRKTASAKNTSTSTSTSPRATTSTTKNTTRDASASPPASTAPGSHRKESSSAVEVVHAVLPQESPGWEEVLSVNGSSWRELNLPAPVQSVTCNSLSSEHQDTPSAWPHDMEGSWTFVDGSHIPVSFSGLPGALPVEAPLVAEVDDEWSAVNSGCADLSSDWSAPHEEWGNYEARPVEGAVTTGAPHTEVQESDADKDKDEAAAPGSGKAKKKKKKKKKVEEGGGAAQVEGEVGVAKDQNTAGKISPHTPNEQETAASSTPLRVAVKPPETTAAPAAHKKAEESWESPKQVKKKKARRET